MDDATKAVVGEIEDVISNYAKSSNDADVELAARIWLDTVPAGGVRAPS